MQSANGQATSTWCLYKPHDPSPPPSFFLSPPSLSSPYFFTPSSLPIHHHSLPFVTTGVSHSFAFLAHKHTSSMEKHSKDFEEAIKDQQREGYHKGACDHDVSQTTLKKILPSILNLYGSNPTPQDFEIYAPDATFEDPLMCAHGIKQIKSAFYSIGKVFSESRIVEYTIQENAVNPNKTEILIDNKQYYKFLGKDIHMISLIRLLVENEKVVRHEDRWDKKPLWNRETVKLPLAGRVIEATRRVSMMATHVLMGFGKDPTV